MSASYMGPNQTSGPIAYEVGECTDDLNPPCDDSSKDATG